MNDLTIPQELASQPMTLLVKAQSLTVDSQVSYEIANTLATGAGSVVKALEDFFNPNIKQAHELHKSLTAQRNKVIAPAQEARTHLKAKMVAYHDKQEQERLAEQHRLQAQADEAARKEREAFERKAAAAKRPETIAKYAEAAEQVVAPVVMVAPPPKVAGQVFREIWKHEVVDLPAFLDFAIKNNRTDLLLPNQESLKGIAKGMNVNAHMPGVRFYAEKQLAQRSA